MNKQSYLSKSLKKIILSIDSLIIKNSKKLNIKKIFKITEIISMVLKIKAQQSGENMQLNVWSKSWIIKNDYNYWSNELIKDYLLNSKSIN